MTHKPLTKEKILSIIQSKGWFWVDHYKGLVKKLRALEREGKVVKVFKNKHGIYYERPNLS
jgi:hypothetical protein